MKYLAAAVALALSTSAVATGKKPPKPEPSMLQQQQQLMEQYQKTTQSQEATATSHSTSDANSLSTSESAASAAASNEGNELSVNSNYESGPANLVLVPNNNTERCLRVFGFSFGNKEGSGMVGVPWRSAQCDYMGYASEAAAYGDHDLAWFWRCHMKTAYKTFKSKGETVESAVEDCITKNSGANFLADKAAEQKAAIEKITRERDAALLIIKERDKEALRLKEEVTEKRLQEAVRK